MFDDTKVTVLKESDLKKQSNIPPFVELCMRDRERSKPAPEKSTPLRNFALILVLMLISAATWLSAFSTPHAWIPILFK